MSEAVYQSLYDLSHYISFPITLISCPIDPPPWHSVLKPYSPSYGFLKYQALPIIRAFTLTIPSTWRALPHEASLLTALAPLDRAQHQPLS